MRLHLWLPLVSSLCACSSTTDSTPTPSTDAAIVTDTAVVIDAATDGVAVEAGAYCNNKVVIALFGDDKCATEVFRHDLEIGKTCSGWSRPVGTGTRDNSATRFQCYRDRICYTQYVGNIACDLAASTKREDKESNTTLCIKDPTPGIWTKVASGTENCPEAPPGFACPPSNNAGGTEGLKAACTP